MLSSFMIFNCKLSGLQTGQSNIWSSSGKTADPYVPFINYVTITDGVVTHTSVVMALDTRPDASIWTLVDNLNCPFPHHVLPCNCSIYPVLFIPRPLMKSITNKTNLKGSNI